MALSVEFSQFFYNRTSLGDTALHEACYRRDIARVETIVHEVVSNAEPKEGYDFIAEKNSSGQTAIDLVANDEEETGQRIYLLLKKTISSFSLTSTPLSEVEPTLTTGAVPNPLYSPRGSRLSLPSHPSMEGMPPIFKALITKNVRALVHRIKEKDDVNEIYEGQTPLTIAVCQKNLTAVKILLKAEEIQPAKKNSAGRTPLELARRSRHHEMIQLLLAFEPCSVLVD